MASFFNLILDTTAPAGVTLALNDDARYTTSASITAKIGCEDAETTGYQMKIWGSVDGAATEDDAAWVNFAATKEITLTTGDGKKTVNLRVRDDVGNEFITVTKEIILDTAVPVVTVTGPDKSKISKVATFNVAAISFTCDVDFVEYKVKVVPATTSLQDAGVVIGTTNGSTNMSGESWGVGIGTLIASFSQTPANTSRSFDIYDDYLVRGDGEYRISLFAQGTDGSWYTLTPLFEFQFSNESLSENLIEFGVLSY